MSTNAVNIGTGNASGMFYHAALTPTPPAMPTSPFDTMEGFTEVGFVGEDGPSWTPYGSTEIIRAWSLATVRNIKTEKGSVCTGNLHDRGVSEDRIRCRSSNRYSCKHNSRQPYHG